MIHKSIRYQHEENHFLLLPEKAVFWEEPQWLLVADIHAGMAGHFRKHGIPLSSDHFLRDMNRLEALIKRYSPKKVMVLGDLFHSDENMEKDFLLQWIDRLPLPFELIIGNHDVHSNWDQLVTHNQILHRNVLLSHEPEKVDSFNIHGHLHPAYSLSGKARQRIKLPCFYLNEQYMVLPSFGSTTGGRSYTSLIEESSVYAITDSGIIEV